MAEPKETAAPAPAPPPVIQGPSPVAVATVKKNKAPQSLVLPMVNDRASHFYFRRVRGILRALGHLRH